MGCWRFRFNASAQGRGAPAPPPPLEPGASAPRARHQMAPDRGRARRSLREAQGRDARRRGPGRRAGRAARLRHLLQRARGERARCRRLSRTAQPAFEARSGQSERRARCRPAWRTSSTRPATSARSPMFTGSRPFSRPPCGAELTRPEPDSSRRRAFRVQSEVRYGAHDARLEPWEAARAGWRAGGHVRPFLCCGRPPRPPLA